MRFRGRCERGQRSDTVIIATMAHDGNAEAVARALVLRQRIKAAGFTIADFGRRAGFTRNVTYGILKGRLLRQNEAARIDAVLGRNVEEQVFVTQKRDS